VEQWYKTIELEPKYLAAYEILISYYQHIGDKEKAQELATRLRVLQSRKLEK
jgi:Tfp pilus assembly protein PilF